MSNSPAQHTLTIPINRSDHIRGSLDAPLQLVEYGDYECPFCGMAHPVVEEVERLLSDRLCFAFRHFPIVNAHPHALRAAEAAEAAAEQDAFWAMHKQLFEHQDALDDEALTFHAEQIGLDLRQFVEDLDSHRFIPRVREDLSSGARSGVNGTPTFFVNGRRYEGVPDVQSLTEALQLTAPITR
jgi:formate-nitrite transporter family protein